AVPDVAPPARSAATAVEAMTDRTRDTRMPRDCEPIWHPPAMGPQDIRDHRPSRGDAVVHGMTDPATAARRRCHREPRPVPTAAAGRQRSGTTYSGLVKRTWPVVGAAVVVPGARGADLDRVKYGAD